jgi:isopentenyl diphosphate isomerase/L-lactate dehydrogenase-like FMN-dependent dehydrogenase
VLGTAVDSPVGIARAPFTAGARGRRAATAAPPPRRQPHTLSTFANTAVEEIARIAAPRLWFQLYLSKDRELSRALVQRAFAAGAARSS